MNLIFAPHPDDEMIGCWSLLQGPGSKRVALCLPAGEEREHELRGVCKQFNAGMTTNGNMALYNFINATIEDWDEISITVWAPDPHWELHPDHKMIGMLVQAACKVLSIPFGTYSTSMNCPYIRTLPHVEAVKKRAALNQHYPSQRELWVTDHKYWLFEGRALWNPSA